MSFNPSPHGHVARPAQYGVPAPAAESQIPAGTFAPGTKIQVGNHKVVIQKYFSQGGFAHVYLVKLPKPIDGTDIAVLKRVAVPDKDSLANMRTEVETMKKLKGHRPIVTYYDSHASQLRGGGYEVFLLMEFCNGGGLINFMNTRLENRLTEPEILKIFSDVAEGVACMHYLKPPLLHRDLKVENVLIVSKGVSKRFKLCDFGSTAPPRPAASNVAECRLIEDDIQQHTTIQYRSPEMIDVYRKQPIDEKSDIWALGVLLYKLCYYTTPFEEQGQLAILNASYKFPAYPPFSDTLKKLIASMLKENPRSRPNIYQVLREACLMQGLEVPMKDIYVNRTQSEVRRNQQLPSPEPTVSSPPAVGAVYSPPPPKLQVVPDIVPMRRGRPAASPTTMPRPSPSPLRGSSGDPFAALDGRSASTGKDDEVAARFPSLDQFSLLHDHGSKFEFDSSSASSPQPKGLSQRVTEKLADDAFAIPSQATAPAASSARNKPSGAVVSKAQKIISSTPEFPSPRPENVGPAKPTSQKPTMVSQGTMTSPPPNDLQIPKYNQRPIYRFPPPDHVRSASLPRRENSMSLKPQLLKPDSTQPSRPSSMALNSSYQSLSQHSSSSRPSLEGGRTGNDQIDPPRRNLGIVRPRPASTHLESNLDYLRERERERGRDTNATSLTKMRNDETSILMPSDNEYDNDDNIDDNYNDDAYNETNIESNVDFLRKMEDNITGRGRGVGSGSGNGTGIGVSDKRRSGSGSKYSKRSSMPSMSLSGTKTLLAGKFGDAFKRFENNASAPPPRSSTPSPPRRSTSPSAPITTNVISTITGTEMERDRRREQLTPIAGSEATDGRSDDGHDALLFVEDDGDDSAAAMMFSPEQRRERERRRLSHEERRVAAAAAEYRRRVAARDNSNDKHNDSNSNSAAAGAPPQQPLSAAAAAATAAAAAAGSSRARNIQSKVQSLLAETAANKASSSSPPKRTAEGYGRYTDTNSSSNITTTNNSSSSNYGNSNSSSIHSRSLPTSAYMPSSYDSFDVSSAASPAKPHPHPYPYPTATTTTAAANASSKAQPQPPAVARKPLGVAHSASLPANATSMDKRDRDRDLDRGLAYPKPRAANPAANGAAGAAGAAATGPAAGRPSAPPKPLHLNGIATGPLPRGRGGGGGEGHGGRGMRSAGVTPSAGPATSRPGDGEEEEAMAGSGRPGARRAPGEERDGGGGREDVVADFSKRFPSLAGIEMVETVVRTKEV